MVDQTLDEVRVVQEINKGKRHTELRKNYQDKITKHIESCSVQSLEKIVTIGIVIINVIDIIRGI